MPAYLDHHTASSALLSVVEEMGPFFKQLWGSTAAPHQKGQELFVPLKKNLEVICAELGLNEDDHFHFTHSGAEAINGVFLSHYLDSIRETGRNHLLTTNTEEAPILMSMKRLENLGCAEKILSVNSQGQITRAMLDEAIRPRTSLFSLSWANGLTGVIHPIADLAQVCQEKQVRMHVDASYVIGKLFFRFEDLPVDFLTFDGHLIRSVKGTGGLLIKKGTPYHPLVAGYVGENVAGISALSKALQENSRYFDQMNLETVRLRNKLEEGILAEISDAVVFFKDAERLPNCCAIGFPGANSDALLYLLNRKGVYASLGGGHCQTLSHILIACGVDPVLSQCALSFSLSFDTTEEEIDFAIKTISTCVKQLKQCSFSILEEVSS